MAEAVSIIMYATIELTAPEGHRSGEASQQGIEQARQHEEEE